MTPSYRVASMHFDEDFIPIERSPEPKSQLRPIKYVKVRGKIPEHESAAKLATDMMSKFVSRDIVQQMNSCFDAKDWLGFLSILQNILEDSIIMLVPIANTTLYQKECIAYAENDAMWGATMLFHDTVSSVEETLRNSLVSLAIVLARRIIFYNRVRSVRFEEVLAKRIDYYKKYPCSGINCVDPACLVRHANVIPVRR